MIEQHTIDNIKSTINLISLAEQRTALHRASAKEMAGPCPLCGGNDRFHCAAEWFFCRQCHPERGDAIEFAAWVENIGFREAVAILMGQAIPTPAPVRQPTPSRPQRKPIQDSESWNAKKRAMIATAQRAILTDEGRAGLDYLIGRGLTPATIKAFGIGYRPAVALPGTWNAEKRERSYPAQPAIAIPWIVAGYIRAIRYRFLSLHSYTDAEGRDRKEKQTAEFGSNFAGTLYGGHLLQKDEPATRTLIICEGELNAMSIYQVSQGTRLDALSTGAEKQAITPAMVAAIQRYGTVIVWADREEIARGMSTALPFAHPIKSPGGMDANDLLQAGKLGAFLAAVRRDRCQSDEDRAALYQNLLAGHRNAATEKIIAQLRPVTKEDDEARLWNLWDRAYVRKEAISDAEYEQMIALAEQLGKQL